MVTVNKDISGQKNVTNDLWCVLQKKHPEASMATMMPKKTWYRNMKAIHPWKLLKTNITCNLKNGPLEKEQKTYANHQILGFQLLVFIGGGTWRIIPISKWLITMVSFRPLRRVVPLPNGRNGL